MKNIVKRRPNKGGYSPLGVAIPSAISVGAIAAESGGPAMLDTAWNFSIPCVSFPEGGAIPAGHYSYNGLYSPEINPATGTTYLQWDLSTATPVTGSASPNCADVAGQFDQIRIPEVTFGTNSFYAAILDPVTTDTGSTEAGLTDGNEVHCHPQPYYDLTQKSIMLSTTHKVKVIPPTRSFLLKIPPWQRLFAVLLQLMVLLAFSSHGNTAYAYTVKVVVSGPGADKATVSGAASYNGGAKVTVNVTPFDYNTVVSSWNPSFCQYSFTMPTKDVICYASMAAAPLYSFSVKTTGYGTGSTSGSTVAGSYPKGKPITLVAQAGSGSTFAGWSPATCTSSFTMPGNNLVCTATFTQKPFYTLQLKISGRGKVTSNILGGLYDGKFQEGTVIDLKPELLESSSEWYFSGWSPAPCANSFKMPKQNLTCTATFSTWGYPWSVKTAGLGKGTVTGGTANGNYAAGTTTTLGVPTPEPGSVFVGWSPEACRKSSKGGIIFEQGGTLIMPVNGLECTANFSVPAKLSVRTGGTGTGNFSVDVRLVVLYNMYVSGISGSPSIREEGVTRYNFDSVSGDYFSLSAKATDITTNDYFWTKGSGGTAIIVKSTFKGWIPSDLCGNGVFTMGAQDLTCTAVFDLPSYTFNTATAGSGTGSVVGTANGSYAAGTLVSLSAKANPGSVFTHWEPVPDVGQYVEQWKITSLNGCSGSFKLYSDTVCTAYFEIGYAFNTATDGTGTGTVTGTANGTYAAGQTINLVATPTGHSAFTGWSAGCSNSFPMPAQNLTCTANFTVTHPLNTATTGTGAGTVLVTAANVVERLIYTVAGNGTKGYSGDGGLATNAQLLSPSALVADSKGNLYFIEREGKNTLRKIDSTGIINNVMIIVNDEIDDLAVDNSGNLYITDMYNNKILKIDENGIINTAVGNGTPGYSGDGGLAANAQLSFPVSIAIDSNNNLYIGDYDNHCIRKVDTNGIISTVAGGGSQGRWDYNGLATNVQFSYPRSIALDRSGNLYIAEQYWIRKVDTTGMISTIAGSDTPGYSEDGGPAINAKLGLVFDIALDDEGNLYIIEDMSGHPGERIRKVDTKGTISTLSPSKEGSDGATVRTAGLGGYLTVYDGNLYFFSNFDFISGLVIRKIELFGNKGSAYYYLSGTPISLTATPKKGSVFAGWSPGCAEPFTMPADQVTCTATFNLENDSTVTEGSSAIITEDSKIGIITDACPKASLDNEFNLKIPCVKVNNLQYAAELHYMGKVDNNPYWRLDSAINSDCTWDANTCAVMDDESQVTLPNILIDGVHTTAQLKPYLNPTAPNELFWKYEGVPVTTH
ncbi:MAG: hypothetical protein BWK78_00625 [Thiotrichaceae bacterium IS1]|nr:MAG: hypothetical protein BWK78_00625 [Thiotrichaceae bacterium IS1]